MARMPRKPDFDQILQDLRAHSFDVKPYPAVANGTLVSKQGVGAVLVPGRQDDEPVAFAVHPGIVVCGEIARLLDRGYQKFIKTSQYELPATAGQLHAIHSFTEELKLRTGDISLYNESLGTTSDLYEYDRLKGREAPEPPPVTPWQLAEGH
jgi:hypothetical protein